MEITFDSAAATSTVGLGSSLTFSHITSGIRRVLFVTASVLTGVTITGITYNGVAMTQIASVSGFTNSYLFFLASPTIGTNNIIISASNGSSVIWGASASYIFASQTGIPDAFNTNGNSSTSISAAVTTIANNCWVVGAGLSLNGGLNAGANTTVRKQDSSGGGASVWIGDNNISKTPPGSVTLTVNANSGPNNIIVASFAPTANIFSPFPNHYNN